MFLNDIFLQDEYYENFNLTNDLPTSGVIGAGAQFTVKRLRLEGSKAVRTSGDACSRLRRGDDIILKKPKLFNPTTGEFSETRVIEIIVNELRLLSHPPLRNHPNVLDVYGVAWELQEAALFSYVWPVLMVEYAAQGTLADFLQQEGELDYSTKMNIFQQIVCGVSALHQCNIVHSDLKPENVLVCRNGSGNLIAKLSDFGLSIIVDEVDATHKLDNGTKLWMAPEWGIVMASDMLYKSDIYSCGLLFWFIMIDGQEPWGDAVFGDPSNCTITFQNFKADGDILCNIAYRSILSRQATTFHADQESVTLSIVNSMLRSDAQKRTLVYTRGGDDIDSPGNQDSASDVSGTQILRATPETRKLFDVYRILQEMHIFVQRQLLLALQDIANSSGQPQWRRAEACFSLSVFYILKIGTIHPQEKTDESRGYTGYRLDSKGSLLWMKKAADLGLISAQAVYARLSDALGEPIHRTSLLFETVKHWLDVSTRAGSLIASQDLRVLDHETWVEADHDFRTAFYALSPYSKLGEDFEKGDKEAIRNLLESKKLLLQQTDQKGDSVLHYAAMSGYRDAIGVILTQCNKDIDINCLNHLNETPLFFACRSGHYPVVRQLLSAGADAGLCTAYGENVLHWLGSFDKDEDAIILLAKDLERAGAKVDQISSRTYKFHPLFLDEFIAGTPLERATSRGQLKAVNALLALSADPYYGKSIPPIHLACFEHNASLLRLFLSSKYPVRQPKWAGKPVMRLQDYPETLLTWIRDKTSHQVGSPRYWAWQESLGNDRSLIGSALRPDHLHQRMILHGKNWKKMMMETISLLLEMANQNVDRVSATGVTGLMEAVASRDYELITYLLDVKNAQFQPLVTWIQPTPERAWIPIQLAIRNQDKLIFDRLLSAAGPNTLLSYPKGSGAGNYLWSWILYFRNATVASIPANVDCMNIIHLIASTTVDPAFGDAILRTVRNPEKLLNEHGWYGEVPLTLAAVNHAFGLADLFLRYGADLEKLSGRPIIGPFYGHYTPLGSVLRMNTESSTGTVKYLLEKGANFIVCEKPQLSAFAVALAAGKHYEMADDQSTPICDYAYNPSNLIMLLEHFPGSKHLNHQDKDFGQTALHLAVFYQNVVAVRVLRKAGARADVANARGQTPLDFASGREEVPEAVRSKGMRTVQKYSQSAQKIRQLLERVATS